MEKERKKKGKCEFFILTDGLFNSTTGFLVRKRSPYIELLNRGYNINAVNVVCLS